MITLYHGSNIFIEKIDLAQCNPYKDFGQAFYLTTDIVQAKDVANARVDIFRLTCTVTMWFMVR